MTILNHVSAQDISSKWSKVTRNEANAIKNVRSLGPGGKELQSRQSQGRRRSEGLHGHPHLLSLAGARLNAGGEPPGPKRLP